MKFIATIFLFLLTSLNVSADINDDIANAIRSGDIKTLSRFLGDNVELKLIDLEEIYSRAQAEVIIKDFFNKHKVESFFISHKSTPKNDSMYSIGTLQTSKGKFRTYFFIKKLNNKFVIQQFRIESDKE